MKVQLEDTGKGSKIIILVSYLYKSKISSFGVILKFFVLCLHSWKGYTKVYLCFLSSIVSKLFLFSFFLLFGIDVPYLLLLHMLCWIKTYTIQYFQKLSFSVCELFKTFNNQISIFIISFLFALRKCLVAFSSNTEIKLYLNVKHSRAHFILSVCPGEL